MKRLTAIFLSIILGVFLTLGSTWAYEYDINDEYIGGWPSNPTYFGRDLIGDASVFQIHGMNVTFDNEARTMSVNIYANYFDNIISRQNLLETELGDLFISTDGYDPVLPTEEDHYYGESEDWEFAIALNDHDATSGTANLYAIDNGLKDALYPDDTGDIKLSWIDIAGFYRDKQEAQVNTDGLISLATATWSINYSPDGDQYNDYLSITVAGAGDGWSFYNKNLGFHWTMSCANDVIEGEITSGSDPVPEPATMMLFGSGLVGLAGLGRKRFLKKG